MILSLVVSGEIYLALGDLQEALVLLASVFVVMGITVIKTTRRSARSKRCSNCRVCVRWSFFWFARLRANNVPVCAAAALA